MCCSCDISRQDKRGLGARPPKKYFDIRCSEIASEAILGQKQSHMAATWLTEYCIHFLAVHICINFAKPADIEFPREMILQLAEQQVGLQMMK